MLLNGENKSYVGIQFNAEANATSIANSTLSSFYRSNQELSKEDLQNSVSALNNNNYAGGNAWTRIFYQEKLRRKPIAYYRIAFEYTDLVSAKFSGDLLGLVMLGNKGYEDKTAHFNNTRFTNYNAQKIGFYVGKKLDKNTMLDIGGSFIKGGRYQYLKTKKGSLYTAPYGEYLEGEIDLNYNSTPKEKSINILGYGATTDVHWSYKMKDTSLISFGINDFGVMNWQNIQTSTLDTSFYFEGLVIENIFDTINLSTNNISPDSIDQVIGVKTTTKNKWVLTPFTLFANYKKEFGDKIILSVGAQYTYGIAMLPLVTATVNYKVKEGFNLYPILSYGGFGSYNIGFGVDKTIKDNINLRVQSRFLDGIVRYSSKGGQGIYLSVIYKI